MAVAPAEIDFAFANESRYKEVPPSEIIAVARGFTPNITAAEENYDVLPVAADWMVHDVQTVIASEGNLKGTFPLEAHKSNPGSYSGRFHLVGDTPNRHSYFDVVLVTPTFHENKGQITNIQDGTRLILERYSPNHTKNRLEVISPFQGVTRLAEVVLLQTKDGKTMEYRHVANAVRVGLQMTEEFSFLEPRRVKYVANGMTTKLRSSPRAELGLRTRNIPRF